MSDQALIRRNDGSLSITFTEQAQALKENALECAALIGRVTNADENRVANEAQAKLSELRRTVEKARKEAKEPVLKYGKLIDSTAETFIVEVAKEEMRVAKLIGDFFQLEQAKTRAAEAAARLEAEKLERERLAELTRIAEENAREQAKIHQAEVAAQRAATEAKNAKEREAAERLQAELERQRELAKAKSHDDLDAANEKFSNKQAEIQSAVAAPIRAAGQTVKQDIEITVTDIWLLAKAHPACVNIEPKLSEIKGLINAGVKVAGVISKAVFKTSTRTPRAIEV